MTELDLTILAIVGRDGPLSAYDVRKVFAGSVTPTWSSSTGSVYPSIARLEAAGLVIASAPDGARSRKTLTVTGTGQDRLEAWLGDITAVNAAPTPDPIRTRLFFLSTVDERRRAKIVNAAITCTEEALSQAERLVEARSKDEKGRLAELVSEGALFELRARLAWLRALAAYVGDQSSGRVDPQVAR